MTRTECEHRIALHFEAIIKMAREYDPDCDYLSAAMVKCDDGDFTYFITNGTGEEATKPIDFHRNIKGCWNDVLANRDPMTGLYTVLVNGEIVREHLAQDELSDLMKELMP